MREALLNVERHSGARTLHLALFLRDEEVVVRIRDDGRGFDPSLRGHGISGMRERAEWIGAILDIDSGPSGTTVEIRLSLTERRA